MEFSRPIILSQHTGMDKLYLFTRFQCLDAILVYDTYTITN
jgi:hypothetical protein